MNKTLKFKGHFVEAILNHDKITTTRLDDNKDLSVGDMVDFVNSETNERFAAGKITGIKIITFAEMVEDAKDKQGMYDQYKFYYNREIAPKDQVKVIDLQIIEKL